MNGENLQRQTIEYLTMIFHDFSISFKEITIHTTATDKVTGDKVIVAGKKVTIVDTVTLDGLEEGRKYQLKGWQMLKEENAELLIDGKRVESDYTFVADSEKMKVEISYTFDASELGRTESGYI